MKKFKGTTAQFKKNFRLKELPELLKSEMRKYVYMGYFIHNGRFFSHNGYGSPGYVEEIPEKDLPDDISFYKGQLLKSERMTPTWEGLAPAYMMAIQEKGAVPGISAYSEIMRMAKLADKYAKLLPLLEEFIDDLADGVSDGISDVKEETYLEIKNIISR